jgi:signal transduction histidine kinase/DNA-binding response OmpR family regulator
VLATLAVVAALAHPIAGWPASTGMPAALAIVLAAAAWIAYRGARTRPAIVVLEPTRTTSGATDALAWITERTEEAFVLSDRAGVVLYVSRAGRELLGAGVTPGATLDGGPLCARFSDGEAFADTLRQLYAQPERADSGELVIADDGTLRVCGWTSGPLRDATERIVGRGFLFSDRTQQRELAALKSDFLSTVTHELRTPLTSVKGSLQLILGKAEALSAIERELLDISLKNTDRLIRLINDILDISRLEFGKIDLTFASIAPAPVVEEAVAGLRAYAAGRDIAIGCEIEPDLADIAGDRDRLIQVFTNLISNAVKFSPAGGRVLVRATRALDGLAIAIRDWGVGISAIDHKRLFQRFHRINPGTCQEPGTGLGLAISKAIIDRHGGRITVESREHEGSTFTVLLPLVAEARETASPVAGATDAVPTAARPTILLIDDDADLGTVLEVSLSATYRLLRVERGVQALDVARAERPDLILLDVVLPDLSGYDVLRILQHSEATRAIPVVMLTVQPERELAQRLGAAGVVAKPVDIDELQYTVRRSLARRAVGAPLRVAVGPLQCRPIADLTAALRAGGHEVFPVADAWELLRCADEHDPDVAVVDAAGEHDPEKTLAFLRGHASTRRLPLVLLTAVQPGAYPSGCTPVSARVRDDEVVRVIEDAARQRGAAT